MKKVILSLSVFAMFGVLLTGCQSSPSVSSQEVVPVADLAHYADYSVEKFAEMTGKKSIVFFYADWCSTCRKWEKEVMNEVLPEGAMVFKADYDKEGDLKSKYGVTSQSTAVFINEDGSVAEVASDPSMERVKEFFMDK